MAFKLLDLMILHFFYKKKLEVARIKLIIGH